MADTYEVVVQYPTIENLGGSQTRQVMAVGYRTIPHNIYVEVRIPRTIYDETQVMDYGIGYSGTIESLFGITGVNGLAWIQTPQLDGTLLDQMIVGVQSTSGNSSSTITVPFGMLAPTLVAPLVKKLVAQLDAAEAL